MKIKTMPRLFPSVKMFKRKVQLVLIFALFRAKAQDMEMRLYLLMEHLLMEALWNLVLMDLYENPS
jgi:hypothetical protein